MKKINTLFISAIAGLLILGISSCGKKKQVGDLVLDKWFIKQLDVKTTQDGHESKFEYPVTDADYFRFKDDNSFVRSLDGTVISGSYLILSDTRMVINYDTAIISKIDNKTFEFMVKSIGVDRTTESGYFLKK